MNHKEFIENKETEWKQTIVQQLTFEGISIFPYDILSTYVLQASLLSAGHALTHLKCTVLQWGMYGYFWSLKISGSGMSKVSETEKPLFLSDSPCYNGAAFSSFFKSPKYMLFIEMELFSLLFVNSLF